MKDEMKREFMFRRSLKELNEPTEETTRDVRSVKKCLTELSKFDIIFLPFSNRAHASVDLGEKAALWLQYAITGKTRFNT